jgi:nicotinamidase-related amidase
MNYPNQKDNPARQALTRAVDKAIAEGAPVYVNEPAKIQSILRRTALHLLNRENQTKTIDLADRAAYVLLLRKADKQ